MNVGLKDLLLLPFKGKGGETLDLDVIDKAVHNAESEISRRFMEMKELIRKYKFDCFESFDFFLSMSSKNSGEKYLQWRMKGNKTRTHQFSIVKKLLEGKGPLVQVEKDVISEKEWLELKEFEFKRLQLNTEHNLLCTYKRRLLDYKKLLEQAKSVQPTRYSRVV